MIGKTIDMHELRQGPAIIRKTIDMHELVTTGILYSRPMVVSAVAHQFFGWRCPPKSTPKHQPLGMSISGEMACRVCLRPLLLIEAGFSAGHAL